MSNRTTGDASTLAARRIGDPRGGETISSQAVIEALQSRLGEAITTTANQTVDEIRDIMRRIDYTDTSDEVIDIWFQAANDYTDLVADLFTGRGRPAARTARALVEHMINFFDVSAHEESRERYRAHEAVAAIKEAEAQIGLDRLSGEERDIEVERLRSLMAMFSDDYDQALNLYTRKFRLGWANDNLRSRAEAAGLEDFYAYYGIASATLHGSAGGLRGSINQNANVDNPARRLGASLMLCVDAYHEGIRAFLCLTERLEATSDTSVAGLTASLTALLDFWPEYRRVILGLDGELWSSEASEAPLTVCKVYPNGRLRWYRFEPTPSLMCLAHPPASTVGVDEARVRARKAGVPIAMTPLGVHVETVEGAKWFPASAVLDDPDEVIKNLKALSSDPENWADLDLEYEPGRGPTLG